MENNRVILMLSGGRDSFLSACRLIEDDKNYFVCMVTYDNGCTICAKNAKTVADRIISKYGKNKARYIGTHNIFPVIREFLYPYLNMKPKEQAERFSGMTPSQFQCLVCRTSMYIYSVWIAKKEKAKYIAEGGRKDQGFVIELPGMAMERFPKLIEHAGLKLLLPVYNMNDDWERDNELLRRGFISKTLEAKCLIGYPLKESVDNSVIEGIHRYFDDVIMPRILELDLLSNDCYMDDEYREF